MCRGIFGRTVYMYLSLFGRDPSRIFEPLVVMGTDIPSILDETLSEVVLGLLFHQGAAVDLLNTKGMKY